MSMQSFRTPDDGSSLDEQWETVTMLRESAKDFARDKTAGRPLRAFRHVMPGYDPQLLAEMGELGWLGILAPATSGGMGLGFREMAAVLEETSAYLIAEPLTATVVLAGRVLERSANTELRSELLSNLVAGQGFPALAWQERLGNRDVLDVTTTLRPAGHAYRLEGQKQFVVGAGAASGFVVSCKQGEELILVWVPASQVKVASHWRSDGVPVLQVTFDDVPVSKAQILQAGVGAADALRCTIIEATVMVCAELVGLSRRVLAMTLEYMGIREQYGEHIGSFQALRHRAVDLFVQRELAISVTAEAIAALGHEVSPTAIQRLASRAKARCSDAALRITREAIQLHGAIGYTDEHDLGLFVKRALALSAWLGNAAEHRAQYAGLRNVN